MKQKFETRQWVPFRLEVVFAFFANPRNLPRLMPESSQMRIDELRVVPPDDQVASGIHAVLQREIAAGAGSEMVVSFRPVPWLPLRASWLARITEFKWNSHFCDSQVRGPFAHFYHCHRIRAEMQSGAWGTLVTDEIEFALPFGPLGRIASGMVRRQLEKSFAQRQARLIQLIANS
jgi:ligand-binding SRPBCC domain-containing protein